jgi:dTMP kinase
VISDRFADSTRAYQQAAGHVPAALTEAMTAAAIGETIPDLTIILDIAPDVGLARADARRGAADKADAFEASDMAFHAGVRAGYLAIAAREPHRCVVVDAARAVDDVARDIAAIVDAKRRSG